MKIRWGFCLVLFSLAVSPVQAVTVYKWVDEHGRVHFSDRPLGNKVESLRLPGGSRYLDEPAPAAPRREDNTAGTDPAQTPTLSAVERRRQARAQRKLRRQRCQDARERLAYNERISRMYRIGADGERIWLSEAEREAVLAGNRREVKQWCD